MKRIIMLLIMALLPAMVRSEFFGDVCVGAAHTQSGSFDSSYDAGDLGGSTGVAGALRGGYWFKGMDWLGLALDISGFMAESDRSGADVTFSMISPMLMVRYPVSVSEELPYGRFYPYAGGGVSLVFGDISSSHGDSPDELDIDEGGGYFFCIGEKWFVNRNLGFFLEYRYVSVSFEQSKEWQTGALLWPRYDHYYEADGEARAHLLLGGVSIHF